MKSIKRPWLIAVSIVILILAGIANWAKDPCIPGTGSLDVCYSAQAEKTKNVSWCLKIPEPNGIGRIACVGNVALLKNNRSLCNKVSPVLSDDCFKQFDAGKK